MGFKHFSDGDECQNHGRGLEIKFMHISHDCIHIAAHLRSGHGKQGIRTVSKRCSGAECHQCIHIWCAVEQAGKTAHKELLVDHHDDDG